jgi:hypothetical protein
MHKLPLMPAAFPDFDPATLPPMPAEWQDSSWRNDACPSFSIADRWRVYIADADPARRECGPESPRFSLFSGTEFDVGDTVFHGDDWGAVLEEVARRQLATVAAALFAHNLRESVGEDAFRRVRLGNVDAPAGTCASHDVCDANMVMDATLQALGLQMWEEGNEPGEGDMAEPARLVWNLAWQEATPRHLTATPEEVAAAEAEEEEPDAPHGAHPADCHACGGTGGPRNDCRLCDGKGYR